MIIYLNDTNNITKKYNLVFFLMTPTTIFIKEKVVYTTKKKSCLRV